MIKPLLACLLFGSLVHAAETTSDAEFDRGFGETKGMVQEDHAALDADRLKIGGTFQMEFIDAMLDGGTQGDYYQNPFTLLLYGDARLKDDVRAYVLGRYNYDPTINSSVASPLTGLTQSQGRGTLDEAKIQFNFSKKVFWTVGLQKIKWGVGRFWNPTDFINTERRNYFYADDFRSGQPMVKAHVPVGNANFYAILLEQTGNEFKRNAGAFRAEVPFKAGEVSVSVMSKYLQPVWWAADFSVAVGDFDVYGEGAMKATNDRSAAGGISYDFKYNDEDTASLGVEGFWQEQGQTTTTQYTTLLASGNFVPFYVGQFYVMSSLNLAKPGSWNNSNIAIYYVRNNNDSSDYWRASYSYSGWRDMTWVFSAGLHNGALSSEMRLGGQRVDLSILAKLAF